MILFNHVRLRRDRPSVDHQGCSGDVTRLGAARNSATRVHKAALRIPGGPIGENTQDAYRDGYTMDHRPVTARRGLMPRG